VPENFGDKLASALRHIFNSKHTLHYYPRIPPEKVDLVFVSDPVTCNFDLRPFKNAVKAYWSQDCIYGSTLRTQLHGMNIYQYDIVFVAHENCRRYFRELGLRVEWLPFAYDPTICATPRSTVVPNFDLAFIGTLRKERLKLLEQVLSGGSLRYFVGNAYYHDMASIYAKSKIVLNVSERGELNWRVFEALGCRSFLLTNDSGEISRVFEPGKHLAVWRDVEDLRDQIEKYLINNNERIRIAREGHMEVMKKHTIYHRVEAVLRAAGLL
jgi:spore maturation protein CgeB